MSPSRAEAQLRDGARPATVPGDGPRRHGDWDTPTAGRRPFELQRIGAMNWFASKRSGTVDTPTVGLTDAERDVFSDLAASLG